MNYPAASLPDGAFVPILQSYLELCEEAHDLMVQENRALNHTATYPASEFHHRRKNLLPGLEKAHILLQELRKAWQNVRPEIRAGLTEMRTLLQKVQGLLTRILFLDRENQQALLRRGLVPAQHLPPAASQQPHFVVRLYQRHQAD